MKVIKEGKVYDVAYGAYDVISELPGTGGINEVGVVVPMRNELRRDKASGRFYVARYSDGYSREHYSITPVTAEAAAGMAENYLEYEAYVKYFGDPEGAEHRTKELECELESVRKAKDEYFEKYMKTRRELDELKTKANGTAQ